MRAKEYLLQIKQMDKLIENKLAEVMMWKDIATNISVNSEGERVQSQGDMQKMATAVCKYVDLEEEIKKNIQELTAKRSEIIAKLEQLEIDNYDILHKIYVQHIPVAELAIDYKKSYSYIAHKHLEALKELDEKLKTA